MFKLFTRKLFGLKVNFRLELWPELVDLVDLVNLVELVNLRLELVASF